MPPRKRVRGPQLSPVREDSSGLSPEKVVEKSTSPSTSTRKEKTQEDIAREEAELDAIDTLANFKKQVPVTASGKMKNAEILLRSNIMGSFRQTFQARGNIIDNIKHSSQQLLSAYKKTTKVRGAVKKDVFFNEIDIRLCMMIEDTSVIENRIRVLKLVCETACNLILETGDDSILDFLVNQFFATWSKCAEIGPRINIASFIGYLLESGVSKKKNDREFAIFDISYVKKLYLYLLALIRDKVQVRIAAIRAISVIQDVPIPSDFTEAIEFSPKEVLMRSFRDIAWECRLAAIEVFKPTREHVPQLVQLSLFDKCINVRCEALKQFGTLSMGQSDPKIRIELLYTCLNDHDHAIRQAVRTHIINVYLKTLAEKYRESHEPKNDGDCIETDPTGRPLMCVETDKKVEGYGYVAQNIMCLLYDGADTPDLKTQVRNIMRVVLDCTRKFYNVHLEPYEFFATSYVEDDKYDDGSMLHRSTYLDLVESDGSMKDREEIVAFWRVFIDYCVMGAKNNKNDALAAVERMAPKMVKMCDLVRRMLELFKEVEESEMDGNKPVMDMELCSIRQTNMLKDVLLIFQHLDKDPTGLNSWKKLLEDILYNISNHKSLLDVVVHDLMNNFYRESPSDILSDVAAGISDMMNRISCGDATLRDETVFIGSSKTRKIDQQQKEVILAITEYELMILNSVLKTGLIVNVCPILKTKYDTLVIPKLKSTNLDDRILAMECVAMVGMMNLERIETELIVCRRLADIGEVDVKICYVNMIVDLCVVHKTENVQNLLDRHVYGGLRKKDAKTIIDMLCEPILTEDVLMKNSDLALKCCEGLGKLLLNEDIDPDDKMWRQALITLLSRLNYKLDGKFAAKVRSVITAVFKFFASIGKNNQKALVNCFKPFFTEWDRNPSLIDTAGDNGYIYQRLCRCAALIAILTRQSLLSKTQKNELPCHVDLLMDAFKELTYSQESSASNYYCEVMPWIELDMISREELAKILDELNDVVEVYEEEDDSKGRLAELKKLRRRVMKTLGVSDRNNDGAIEIDMQIKEEIIEEPMQDSNENPSSPQPKTTKATPARVRRNVSKSANKTPAPKNKDVVHEIRDLIDSPVQESVSKKPVRQASESRVHLKRSARRLKSDQ